MDYENRLVCFFDILGFKSAINRCETDTEFRMKLYDLLNSLQTDDIKDFLYGNFPVYLLDKQNTIVTAREFHKGKHVEEISTSWPLAITQFSDSFVISCPADNKVSCNLMLKLIYFLSLSLFVDLKLMSRGGLTLGKIFHTDDRVLFGPAMNEAYKLESVEAKYPRVLVDEAAASHMRKLINGSPNLEPIVMDLDGRQAINMVSILSWSLIDESVEPEYPVSLSHIKSNIEAELECVMEKYRYLDERWVQYLQSKI
ncbi:hypothetical protein QFX18_11485 [Saccharophagus degradans]|uniref:hypothetical protein n=1 Tax=Saccharophagus degradans TaxID=86304 RepID=UPI00247829B0|nr:hypothetical protein [Saccharophagus degradans]WGO96668.1 hypothetical protein QFX18_11485 [Saccharophagus degradans]